MPVVPRADCFNKVPAEDWPAYRQAISALRDAGVGFAVGGGVAYGAYAQRSRYTKDLDLFLRPVDRQRAIAAIQHIGFDDYFERKPYERHWIYRGYRDGLILDLIWQMANKRADIDDAWLERGPLVEIHGTQARLIPPEEILWAKLYVLQRERADWPDVWNILARMGQELDWGHLVGRVGSDLPLLAAAVQVYAWFAPKQARTLPEDAWRLLGLARPTPSDIKVARAGLLDSRDWFHTVDPSCDPAEK